MKLPHLCWDRDWQADGIFACYQCRRCGARRTRRITLRSTGPVQAGWPAPVDRHGMPVMDTGWQKTVTYGADLARE